jgi:ABC-type transporter Mla subunit MlaD
MVDFSSAAIEAATRLRGINERAAGDTDRSVENFSHLDDAETELFAALELIDNHAEAISTRVTALRASFEAKCHHLLDHVDQFEQQCAKTKQGIDARIEEIRKFIHTCEQVITNAEAQCQSLAEQVTAEVETKESEIKSAIDDLVSQLGAMGGEIKEIVSAVEAKSSELTSKAEDVAGAISGQIAGEIAEQHDEAVAKLAALKEGFDEHTNTLEKLLTETASEQLQELVNSIAENMERVEQLAERVSTILETIGETAKTTCDTMDTTRDVMNTATKSSTIGIEKAIAILDHIKDILDRV